MGAHQGGFTVFVVDEATGRWSSAKSASDRSPIRARINCVPAPRPRRASLRDRVIPTLRWSWEVQSGRTRACHLAWRLLGTSVPHRLAECGGRACGSADGRGANRRCCRSGWWVGPQWDRAASGILDVVSMVSRIDPDVVFTKTAVIPHGALAADLLGIPHVWFVHEFIDVDHGIDIPVRAKELGDFIARYSTRVVANSPSVGRHVLPEGAAYEVLAPTALPPDEPLQDGPICRVDLCEWLSLGRSVQARGRTSPSTPFRRAPSARFQWAVGPVGSGSPSAINRVRTELDAALLGFRTEYPTGLSADVSEVYRHVDDRTRPEPNEPGRVPVEAIVHGRPVVYSRSGGMDDFMVDRRTGVGFQAGDADALADAILELASNLALQDELRTKALPAVRQWIANHEALPGVLDILSGGLGR